MRDRSWPLSSNADASLCQEARAQNEGGNSAPHARGTPLMAPRQLADLGRLSIK
ncbi:hypothetical protein ACFC0M_02765 [Streptomyces sp. NPDC056149]|uniref:hypothetical protein n=1 Tax=Streptomyces sp. NPDC056149 TaxID=3345728 RepID=UPI0035E1BD81